MAEEANVDEAITAESKAGNDTEIYLKEEQNTQAYKKRNIDIGNINTFEKRFFLYNSMEENLRSYKTRVFLRKLIFIQMIF